MFCCVRHIIYKLTCTSVSENVLFRREKQRWAHFPAVSAAFIISLEVSCTNELLLFYVTRVASMWELTNSCFFLIHWVCLVEEFLGEKKMCYGLGKSVSGCWLPWAVVGPLIIGFVVVTAS